MISDEGNFERQRRNLVFLSCVLILYELAQGEIRGGTIEGTWLTINRPEVIHWALWIALVYTTIRFYQFSPLKRLDFIKQYWHNVNDSEVFRDKLPAVQQTRNTCVIPKGWFGRRWANKDALNKYLEYRERLLRHVAVTEEFNAVAQGSYPTARFRDTVWAELSSAAYILVRRHYGTELFLPYLLAVAAVVIAVVKHYR